MPQEVIDVDALPDEVYLDSSEIESEGGIEFQGFKRTRTPAFKLAELETEGVVYMGYDTRKQRSTAPSTSIALAPTASGSRSHDSVPGALITTQDRNKVVTTGKPFKGKKPARPASRPAAKATARKARVPNHEVWVELPTLSAEQKRKYSSILEKYM